MAASGFLQINNQLIISIIILSITALVICPISITPWAIFGTTIRKLVKNIKVKKIIEYILSAFLLVTAFLIVFNDFKL